MWLSIFVSTFVALILGFIYLVSRFYKYDITKNISNAISTDNKKLRIVVSWFFVVIILVILWLTMGVMNMIVCIIHLVLFWVIFDIAFYIAKKIRKQDFKRYYAGIVAVVCAVVYLSTGWFQAHHVWETDYTIETDKEIGDLRVVQFADSHIGATFNGKDLEDYTAEIQELNPDVVLITGDFVDDDTSKEDMIDACKALGTLKTKYGVYFSFGNHDKGYYGDEYRGYGTNDLITELEKNNVTVLQDENVLIDNRFYIIGRNDVSELIRNGSRLEMSELTKGLDTSKYMIVMDHQPNDYENEKNANIDLVLSGHTHGGQFFPVNRMGEWLGANDKTYGYEKRDNTNFIVTSGIADWAIKFKTGCISEYVVIDIKG